MTPRQRARRAGELLQQAETQEPSAKRQALAERLRTEIRGYLEWWLELTWSDREDPVLSPPDRREVEEWAARGIASATFGVCGCGTVFRRRPAQRRYCSPACRKVRPVAIPNEYRIWHDVSAELGATSEEEVREARRARRPAALGRRNPDDGRVEFLVICECGHEVFARPGQRALCGCCGSPAGRKRRERS